MPEYFSGKQLKNMNMSQLDALCEDLRQKFYQRF